MKLDLYQSLPLGNTFSAGFGNACIHKMGLASNSKVQKADEGGKRTNDIPWVQGRVQLQRKPQAKATRL